MFCCFLEQNGQAAVKGSTEVSDAKAAKVERALTPSEGRRAKGVHFSVLAELEQNLPSSMDKDTVTTGEVIHWMRKNPKLVAAKTSWLKMLESEGAQNEEGVPLHGVATVMVSHTWRYKFKEFVSAVVEFATNQEVDTGKSSYVWIDMFVLNQFSSKSTDPNWLKQTFTDVIKDIGLTVSIITPFEDPVSFRRVWCLWEVYLSITYSKLELLLPKDQRQRFNEALISNPYSVTEMLKQVQSIDARNAEAFDPADRTMIFNAIQSTIGFDQINAVVRGHLNDWVDWQCMAKVKAINSGQLGADEAIAAPTNYSGSGSTFFRAIELGSVGLAQLCFLHPNIAEVINGTPDSWPPFSNALTKGQCDIADMIIEHPSFDVSYIPWQIDSYMIKGKRNHRYHPDMDTSVPHDRVVETLKKFFNKRAEKGFPEPTYEEYVEKSISGTLPNEWTY